jgi:hypothetical protein
MGNAAKGDEKVPVGARVDRRAALGGLAGGVGLLLAEAAAPAAPKAAAPPSVPAGRLADCVLTIPATVADELLGTVQFPVILANEQWPDPRQAAANAVGTAIRWSKEKEAREGLRREAEALGGSGRAEAAKQLQDLAGKVGLSLPSLPGTSGLVDVWKGVTQAYLYVSRRKEVRWEWRLTRLQLTARVGGEVTYEFWWRWFGGEWKRIDRVAIEVDALTKVSLHPVYVAERKALRIDIVIDNIDLSEVLLRPFEPGIRRSVNETIRQRQAATPLEFSLAQQGTIPVLNVRADIANVRVLSDPNGLALGLDLRFA